MSENAPQSFRERLEWAMKRKGGISQSELARQVGVKPQSIQHLLDPKKNAQGSSHTANIALVLGVSAHLLATGDGEPVVKVDEVLLKKLSAIDAQLWAAARDHEDADSDDRGPEPAVRAGGDRRRAGA